jgi:Esterase-like activity of phytase
MTNTPHRRIPLLCALIAATLLGACEGDHPMAPATRARLANRGHQEDEAPTAISAHAVALFPNDVLATFNGVHVYHGGFGSALDQRPGRDGEFYSLTDRGPNVGGSGNDKLFAVPGFHPQVGRFHFRRGVLVRDEVIVLKDAAGNPKSGLPVGASGCGATGEIPRALDGTPLPFDSNGIDSEGLRVMEDGSFWTSDEYGPFVTHFDRRGRTIEQDSPCSGPHPLPAVLTKRQANKGMEGLAVIDGGRVIVGIIQNPLDNPNHAAAKASHLLRIVLLNVRTGRTQQYAYLMDDPGYGASEIEAVSSTRFLVDERDGKFFNDPAGPSVQKKIYLIDIRGATDINDPANGANGLTIGGKTIEQMTDADLSANGIIPVKKTLVVDMLAFGYPHDKAEGIALIDGGRTIAVSNDDDFGVTDDGAQHLIQKLLPSGTVDHNDIWFFGLNRSLYDLR